MWWTTLKPPCVVIVRYILPAINSIVAIELKEKYGLKRVEVAEKMGMTPAAITQYLKGVRGKAAVKTVKSSDKADKMITEIAEVLSRDEVVMHEMLGKICEICRAVISEGLICPIHREVMPILEKSDACPICHLSIA
jgi:predicted transcriptional regulator